MYKSSIFDYFIFSVITWILTKFDSPRLLYEGLNYKSYRKIGRVINATLPQGEEGGRLKLPGKNFKGVKSKFVPQTDTGRLVEYTKAYG